VNVILSLLGVGAVSGLLTGLVVWRWPNHDPAAPRLTADSAVLRVAAVVVLTAAAGLLLLMIRTKTGVARYDLPFARWGATHATPGSTTVLRRLSDLGGTVGVVSLAVIVGIVEFRRLPNRAIPVLLAVTVLGQFAVVNVIKVIVDRARPAIDQLTGFSSSSFPSGHSASAAATFAVIALLLGRRRGRRARAAIAGGAVALAVTVAGTRVLLGVHWLTDVLAGLAIGWAWFALCSISFGGRLMGDDEVERRRARPRGGEGRLAGGDFRPLTWPAAVREAMAARLGIPTT
jgi:undecaprenyl-diphosphatase